MATLQRIRKRSVLLITVVGVALFAFIIGDFLTSGSTLFQQKQQNIIRVNGKNVNYQEYEARIQELENVYKMQSGQSALNEDLTHQIRESAYETIVRENLLDEQAEALGLAVTDKEMFDMVNGENVHYMVQQMPFFQNPETGQFDRNVMMNFLRTIEADDLSMYSADVQQQIQQMKEYWLFWENNMKYSRVQEKVANLLSKSVSANSIDAADAFKANQRSVDFAYALLLYSALSDSMFSITNSEVKARYKQDKEQYRQEPYRAGRYVLVDIEPSQEDDENVQASMQKIYDEFCSAEDIISLVNSSSDAPFIDAYIANDAFSGSFADFVNSASVGSVTGPYKEENEWIMLRAMDKVVRPDSVLVRHIFIRNRSAEGIQLMDSLMDVLKNGGDFADLAQRFSEDATGSNGGEMGWFREIDVCSQFGSDFTEACFTAAKNQCIQTKSKFGLHIIEVMDMTKPVDKTKLAQVIMSVTPSSRTYGDYYNKLNRILADNQTADAFLTAAQENGYSVLSAPMIRQSDNTIGNIPEMRQAVRFVFNGKVGDVSSIFENSKNQFVVMTITDIANDQEYRPIESAQAQVARQLINEHKATSMLKDFKLGQTLAETAENNQMTTDTVRLLNFAANRIAGIGIEPALLSAALTAEKGTLTGPFQGRAGIYVIEVISDVTNGAVFDVATEKEALDANDSYRVAYQSYQAVRDEAEVEDSRIRFY